MNDILLIHFWCLVLASLASATCALLGTYLVLRRLSLLGDAISHAVLPGLALAFLISGTREPLPMFVGAAICGLLTAFISQILSKYCRVDQGAALGVVFTTLFALGVVLIRKAADKVDLDPSCVLYGSLEFAPFDTITLFDHLAPRSLGILLLAFFAVLVFVVCCYKELKLASFDPSFADTLGISSVKVHFLLMAFVAATSVAVFESVGSILVIAMFIIPAAGARLLTDSLGMMLLLSVVLGVTSAFVGYDMAVELNTSAAGSMATACGMILFVIIILAPRYGIISRTFQRTKLQLRVLGEDILGLLYRCSEQDFRHSFPLSGRNIAAALGGGWLPYIVILGLTRRRLLSSDKNRCYALTSLGKEKAQQIVSSHRLWETYLVEHLQLDASHVHDTAMKLEHYTDEDMLRRLREKTGHAQTDPHGRKIP